LQVRKQFYRGYAGRRKVYLILPIPEIAATARVYPSVCENRQEAERGSVYWYSGLKQSNTDFLKHLLNYELADK
jgi:hypothetical protein